jgi:hypothetical protein
MPVLLTQIKDKSRVDRHRNTHQSFTQAYYIHMTLPFAFKVDSIRDPSSRRNVYRSIKCPFSRKGRDVLPMIHRRDDPPVTFQPRHRLTHAEIRPENSGVAAPSISNITPCTTLRYAAPRSSQTRRLYSVLPRQPQVFAQCRHERDDQTIESLQLFDDIKMSSRCSCYKEGADDVEDLTYYGIPHIVYRSIFKSPTSSA